MSKKTTRSGYNHLIKQHNDRIYWGIRNKVIKDMKLTEVSILQDNNVGIGVNYKLLPNHIMIQEFRQYVMGTDMARGSDFSAIIVFEVVGEERRIVYSDRRLTRTPKEWDDWVAEVASKYNNVQILKETK